MKYQLKWYHRLIIVTLLKSILFLGFVYIVNYLCYLVFVDKI